VAYQFFIKLGANNLQLDGLEAVNKMNAGSKYDLVLMDIIMPNLDGVSACHLIRQFDNTPIIAMTSNIRSDDISMYFQHGRLPTLHAPEPVF
jgi:osomolarity two-component system response regulator SKN7